MENGKKFEQYVDTDNTLETVSRSPENSNELEDTEADLMLKAFENGSRFDDEDEKARDYNARLDKADEIKEAIDDINEVITVQSQQLMGLSLTPEQQRLLYEIEQLTARRNAVTSANERAEIDRLIKDRTEEFASLPVTPEQGGLLDEILQSIAERAKLENNLHDMLH
jgi:hypothetical protein